MLAPSVLRYRIWFRFLLFSSIFCVFGSNGNGEEKKKKRKRRAHKSKTCCFIDFSHYNLDGSTVAKTSWISISYICANSAPAYTAIFFSLGPAVFAAVIIINMFPIHFYFLAIWTFWSRICGNHFTKRHMFSGCTTTRARHQIDVEDKIRMRRGVEVSRHRRMPRGKLPGSKRRWCDRVIASRCCQHKPMMTKSKLCIISFP